MKDEPQLAEPDASPELQARRTTRRVPWLLRLVVSILLLAWVLARADLSEVAGALRVADFRLVGLAFCLHAVGWVISVTRWRVLLATKGVRTSFGRLLKSYLSAIFFNNLLPSTVGGDSLRVYDSWRFGAGKAGALAVVGVDRMLGVLALMALAVLALFLAPATVAEVPSLPLWLAAGAGGLLLVTALLLAPTGAAPAVRSRLSSHLPSALRGMVARASRPFQDLRDSPRATTGALALSFLLQLNVILQFFLIARALDLAVPLMGFVLVIPLALAVMAIPISVNAIGLRESAFTFFLGILGVSTDQALAFAWIAFGLVLAQGVIGGVVYALSR